MALSGPPGEETCRKNTQWRIKKLVDGGGRGGGGGKGGWERAQIFARIYTHHSWHIHALEGSEASNDSFWTISRPKYGLFFVTLNGAGGHAPVAPSRSATVRPARFSAVHIWDWLGLVIYNLLALIKYTQFKVRIEQYKMVAILNQHPASCLKRIGVGRDLVYPGPNKQNIDAMLVWCWSNDYDAGPASVQHCVDMLYLLGSEKGNSHISDDCLRTWHFRNNEEIKSAVFHLRFIFQRHYNYITG